MEALEADSPGLNTGSTKPHKRHRSNSFDDAESPTKPKRYAADDFYLHSAPQGTSDFPLGGGLSKIDQCETGGITIGGFDPDLDDIRVRPQQPAKKNLRGLLEETKNELKEIG